MSKKTGGSLPDELFSEYRQMMFNIAMGILHNKSDAEDVVQDAFLWIINNLEKISQIPCNKTASYIAIITEHHSLNKIKKQNNHPLDDIDEHQELSSDVSVEKAAIDKITVEKIKQTLCLLSEKDRYILQLHFFEQRSDSEISEIMGLPEKSVRVYVHRARKRLLKILEKEGIGYDF